jgi:hypothetical protein
MTRRGLPVLLLLGAMLTLGGLDVACGQTPPPAIQGLDKLTPEERAIAERNLERWQRLTPEERQRALENYRHWKSMTPEERRRRARTIGASPAHARPASQILKDFQHWNELPKERQQELQKAYESAGSGCQDRQTASSWLGQWESMTPKSRSGHPATRALAPDEP